MAATVAVIHVAPSVATAAVPAVPVPLSTLQAHAPSSSDAALAAAASVAGASNGVSAGANGAADAELLCWAVRDVRLVLDDGQRGVAPHDRGVGTIYVGSKHLTWWNSVDQVGLQFDYRSIFIHAITRDTAAYPAPCIYCQLGEPATGVDEGYPPEADEDSAEDGSGAATLRTAKDGEAFLVTEARFEPSDPQQCTAMGEQAGGAGAVGAPLVEALFAAISTVQSLHPDPMEEDEEEEEEDDGDADGRGEARQARVRHLDSIFQVPTDAELAAMSVDAARGVHEPADDADDGDEAFDDAEGA